MSLDDQAYERLVSAADQKTPPATLQQMLRLAVDRLLDPPPVEPARVDHATSAAPGSDSTQPSERGDLSTFRIGDVWFGIPVTMVEGIAARSIVNAVPASRPDVAGTILYRSSVIAVIDGSVRLSVTRTSTESVQHVVLRHPEGLMALEVEEVGNLVAAESGTWHLPPAAIRDDLARIGVSELVDTEDRLVHVISAIAP